MDLGSDLILVERQMQVLEVLEGPTLGRILHFP